MTFTQIDELLFELARPCIPPGAAARVELELHRLTHPRRFTMASKPLKAPKKSPTLTAFGEHLREARQRAGLTQATVADTMGLSVAYISLIERGGRNPPLTTVVQLAAAVGTTPARLVPTAA